MAFRSGDRVVYPGYGAGTIVDVGDKVFSGTTTRYYTLRMVANQGEFMVPVEQAEALRIRPVAASKSILRVIKARARQLSPDYKERQAGISQLLASSDARQMSRGVRDLAWYAGTRSLTGRDVQLYEQLQTLLASELSLAQEIGLDEAREQLAETLAVITEKSELRAEREALKAQD